jgi:toxin YoeB
MKSVVFVPSAFKDYVDWGTRNKKAFDKINELILEISRDPFKGTGNPEPLKGNWKGYWSRRITDEHRLIYKAGNDSITIVSCHGHY